MATNKLHPPVQGPNFHDPVPPPIADGLSSEDGEHKLAITDNARYWIGVYDQPPFDIYPGGEKRISTKYDWFSFNTAEERDIAWLIWGGRWGYLWWLTYDDEYHVNAGVIKAFPADLPALVSSPQGKRLLALADQLRSELPNYPKDQKTKKKGREIRVGRYEILKCAHITDEADLLLARAWGIEDANDAAGNFRDRMTFGDKEK